MGLAALSRLKKSSPPTSNAITLLLPLLLLLTLPPPIEEERPLFLLALPMLSAFFFPLLPLPPPEDEDEEVAAQIEEETLPTVPVMLGRPEAALATLAPPREDLPAEDEDLASSFSTTAGAKEARFLSFWPEVTDEAEAERPRPVLAALAMED